MLAICPGPGPWTAVEARARIPSVPSSPLSERDLTRLVDHMFEHVLGDEERVELLVWIRRWEAANPGVDSANRVTGWIDVAYEFQARLEGRLTDAAPARRMPRLSFAL